jgi:hypothetical protein
VTEGPDGRPIAEKDQALITELLSFDAIIIAGQAKSHCVAWTIADLLRGIEEQDRRLARRIYLLEDCTSPVVVPGVVDYTDEADRAFRRFAEAGMHVVRYRRECADVLLPPSATAASVRQTVDRGVKTQGSIQENSGVSRSLARYTGQTLPHKEVLRCPYGTWP